MEQVCSIINDLQENPAILFTSKKTKAFAKILKEKNPSWSGPHEHWNFNGSEADVILYICDGRLDIQTLARARRLLIILTFQSGLKSTNNFDGQSRFLNKVTYDKIVQKMEFTGYRSIWNHLPAP